VSPDGPWIAYVSDAPGTEKVYVSPFPGGGGKWHVSQGAGDEPEWSRDERVLYYLARGGTIMEASVTENGAAVQIGAPCKILAQSMLDVVSGFVYDVSCDGKKFPVDKADQSTSEPLTLVTNWTAELKK
jgi:Tol biopolymer transport system component